MGGCEWGDGVMEEEKDEGGSEAEGDALYRLALEVEADGELRGMAEEWDVVVGDGLTSD